MNPGFITASGLPTLPALAVAALTLAGLVQVVFGWAAVRRFRGSAPPGCVPPFHHRDETAARRRAAARGSARQLLPARNYAHLPDRLRRAIARRYRHSCRPPPAGGAFPHLDTALVIDGTPHGANRKVANLINMFPFARHDSFVISDSDMHAAPGYLCQVADALAVEGTGLVTTLYTGRAARPGLPGLLGSAYITQSFAAGALLARGLGRQDCMGATMALTRDTLMRTGGLPALSPFVADDAVLGAKVRALGQRVTLAATVPATTVAEPGIACPVPPRTALGPHHPRRRPLRLRRLDHPVSGILGHC